MCVPIVLPPHTLWSPQGLLPTAIPETTYDGFVGQPVTCDCPYEAFREDGCVHCGTAALSPELASRLKGSQQVLGLIGGFL